MLKSKKQKLTELLRPIVKSILTEATRDGFSVAYYEAGGGHGDTGKLYPDYKSAMRAAITFTMDKDNEGNPMTDGLEYVGVEPFGNAKKFSILFCTKNYLRVGGDPQGFDDPENAKIWLSVAKRVADAQERSGGKMVVPQNGEFK